MPATYLLLRNNKQSGPYRLEELLQRSLDPHDLIWEEGRSASWRYPYEVEGLKAHVNKPEKEESNSRNTLDPLPPERTTIKFNSKDSASHIYVSLPAGMQPPPINEPPAAASLEAKAEALYQRVQAYSEGRDAEAPDADAQYTRSLNEMKEEYGTWLITQQKKKKRNHLRNKLLIAASILIVSTTGFGLSKWMGSNINFKKQPAETIDLQNTAVAKREQTTAATFAIVSDSFTVPSKVPLLEKDTLSAGIKPLVTGTKKKTVKQKQTRATATDTAQNTLQQAPVEPVPEVNAPVQQEVKKVMRLSQQVTVNGTLATDKNEASKKTKVRLQNNSAETLRSVAVTITYFKKEGRPVGKEIIHFYNVLPSGAPVIEAEGNRRALSAHFEIGTIVRADGSLYLIH